ncbi:MAG: peptidoglycan bridge formation glycyltransferase FemA/FemB family protein [Candidatus Paceibacterota bacterium]
MIEIIELKADNFGKYSDFLLNAETSLFYHSIKYKEFIERLLNCQSHYLLACENDKILAALPLMSCEGKFGKVYNSLPYYGSNGGIVGSNVLACEALIKEYRTLAENCSSATIIENPLENYNYDSLPIDYQGQRISFINSLDFPEDDYLLANIESSTRRNIKKAQSFGIKCEVDNSLMFYLQSTHYENMGRIGGIPKNPEFFQNISKYFCAGEDYNIYAAKKGGEIVAALLLFYFNGTVEYFVPVITKEFREMQPLALIIYQAMLDSAKQGFRRWNWGGTWLSQEGVYRFKKKWGGKEGRYRYLTKINNQDILKAKKEEISLEYPNFFVVPYDKLKT